MRSPSTWLLVLVAAFCVGNVWTTFRRSGIPIDLTGRVERLEVRREKHPGLDDVHLVQVSGRTYHLDAEVAGLLREGDEIRKVAWGAELATPRGTTRIRLSEECTRMAWAMPVLCAIAWLLLARRPREPLSDLAPGVPDGGPGQVEWPPVSDFKHPDGVVSILPWAAHPEAEGARFADRLAELLDGVPSDRVAGMDRALRERSGWASEWFAARTLKEALPAHRAAHQHAFLCLALCHRSGHVRQAAVREAGARLARGAFPRHGALALRLLVLRRNDWVPQVAGEAAAVLDRLLAAGPAVPWVEALPVVVGLGRRARRDQGPFAEAVEQTLLREEWREALLAGMAGTDRQVARTAARHLAVGAPPARRDFVPIALASDDPVVRLVGARAADDVVAGHEREPLLERLDEDPYMPLRRESLRLRALWAPATLDAARRRFLFDRHRALRAISQGVLHASGEDVVAAYRKRLDDESASISAVAVLGLAEVGTAAEARLVAPLATQPPAARRAEAIRCLARLADDAHVELFVAALGDVSPRVARAAAAALAARTYLVGSDRLLALLDRPPHRHVPRIVLRLLCEVDRWAALPPLVAMAAGEAGDDAAWAARLLGAWFQRNRGWLDVPPRSHVEALRRAVGEWGPRLHPDRRREMEFLLATLSAH